MHLDEEIRFMEFNGIPVAEVYGNDSVYSHIMIDPFHSVSSNLPSLFDFIDMVRKGKDKYHRRLGWASYSCYQLKERPLDNDLAKIVKGVKKLEIIQSEIYDAECFFLSTKTMSFNDVIWERKRLINILTAMHNDMRQYHAYLINERIEQKLNQNS